MPYVKPFEFHLRHNFPQHEIIIRAKAIFTKIKLENCDDFFKIEEFWTDNVCEFYFTLDKERYVGKIVVDILDVHITTEQFPCIFSFRIGMIKRYIKSKVDKASKQKDLF